MADKEREVGELKKACEQKTEKKNKFEKLERELADKEREKLELIKVQQDLQQEKEKLSAMLA